MKERPILFSGPMVRALLGGSKTQTRRVFKYKNGGVQPRTNDLPGMRQIMHNCPYGQPGNRLWVRETWGYFGGDEYIYQKDIGSVGYRASQIDGLDHIPGGRWRPSIHMPRWASRLTLEITGVRVERLNDISRADAEAEGCTKNHNGYYWGGPHETSGLKQLASAKGAYRDLWESLNGTDSWAANPCVWVIEFKRIAP
ncbi:MAG: hypothetical protein Q8R67_02530 [Rhodoferax sp.]|nr:hypothetical protein [Rhodoferax sp.]MDP3650537.1 hypothetical protein [Rhodoferax sp.]